jgi:hypothetical protein
VYGKDKDSKFCVILIKTRIHRLLKREQRSIVAEVVALKRGGMMLSSRGINGEAFNVAGMWLH